MQMASCSEIYPSISASVGMELICDLSAAVSVPTLIDWKVPLRDSS